MIVAIKGKRGCVHLFRDWANRLIQVEERYNGVWTVKAVYQYDALNRRVDKRYLLNIAAPTVSRWEFFVHDAGRVVMELFDPDGTLLLVTRSFAYNAYIDAPLLLVDEEGGTPLGGVRKKAYYLQDRRFGVAALANESGAIVERVRYEAFGAMTVYAPQLGGWTPRAALATPKPNRSAYNNPYGFTGRRYDAETATATSGGGTSGGQGLWYYRNRMYSSTLGRFLQRDPAGYVDGFNLYAYVRNNPIAFVDALGLRRLNTGASLSGLNNVPFSQNHIDVQSSYGSPTTDSVLNTALFGAAVASLAPPAQNESNQYDLTNETNLSAALDNLRNINPHITDHLQVRPARQLQSQSPQYSGPTIGAPTAYGQEIKQYFPEYTQTVRDAYVARGQGLRLSRLQRSEITGYEQAFARANALAQRRIYQDREFGSSIGGRLARGVDTFFNPAYNGQGNINDFTFAASGFALAAPNSPTVARSGNRSVGRTDPVFELEVGRAGDLAARSYRDGFDIDHIPAFAAVRASVETRIRQELTPTQVASLREQTYGIVIRSQTHQQASRTYGSSNTPQQIRNDAANLQRAFQLDRQALRQRLIEDGHSPQAVDEAFRQLDQLNRQEGIY